VKQLATLAHDRLGVHALLTESLVEVFF